MRGLNLLLLLLLFVSLGCGDDVAKSPMPKSAEAKKKDEGAPEQGGKPPAMAGAAQADTPRKIIYTAHIDLIVEDLVKAQTAMEKALDQYKGYIAKEDQQQGSPGDPRSGSWTLRVPVPEFRPLRAALLALGQQRRNTLDSQDITDQYYDLEESLKTDKVEEESLRKMYEEQARRSAKPEDLLSIKDKLHAIRKTINTEQGQLNRWGKETTYATIYLTMQDRRGYIPPTDPGFGTTLAQDFFNVDRWVAGLCQVFGAGYRFSRSVAGGCRHCDSSLVAALVAPEGPSPIVAGLDHCFFMLERLRARCSNASLRQRWDKPFVDGLVFRSRIMASMAFT